MLGMQQLPAAGTSKSGQGGTASDCLAGEVRPSTPPELRKFRRSTQLEPGRRFVHYGIADDLDTMNLNSKVFGAFSDRGSNTAADLINHTRPSEMERINQLKAERIYKSTKREQLGKTVDRGNALPSKFAIDNEPFGCGGTRTQSVAAKDVIFPAYDENIDKGGEIYVRSHGSYAPGEQRNRHYQWPVDPHSTRFGCKGDTIAFGGVSKNINDILKYTDERPSALSVKRVEDFRNMGDILGQSRNLGQGSGARAMDTVYGKPSTNPKKSHWTAGDIIRGNYRDDSLQPDGDLGKSIMPGFRNISTEVRRRISLQMCIRHESYKFHMLFSDQSIRRPKHSQ
jgi:Ni/Co efflux regulator RcnB